MRKPAQAGVTSREEDAGRCRLGRNVCSFGYRLPKHLVGRTSLRHAASLSSSTSALALSCRQQTNGTWHHRDDEGNTWGSGRSLRNRYIKVRSSFCAEP